MEVLTENASDKENCVRFAVHTGADTENLNTFLKELVSDTNINLVIGRVVNPVLSKLKVNLAYRYKLD